MSEYKAHPMRVQLSRRKGYRKPAGTVVVSRPSKWGNPYRASECEGGSRGAVECFRVLVESEPETIAAIQNELRGKQLACWCPLDRPCHADVLAEIAEKKG